MSDASRSFNDIFRERIGLEPSGCFDAEDLLLCVLRARLSGVGVGLNALATLVDHPAKNVVETQRGITLALDRDIDAILADIESLDRRREGHGSSR